MLACLCTEPTSLISLLYHQCAMDLTLDPPKVKREVLPLHQGFQAAMSAARDVGRTRCQAYAMSGVRNVERTR